MGGLPGYPVRDRHQQGSHRGRRSQGAQHPGGRGARQQLRSAGITYPVPGNDDAIRAIKLYCELVANTVLDGIQDEMKTVLGRGYRCARERATATWWRMAQRPRPAAAPPAWGAQSPAIAATAQEERERQRLTSGQVNSGRRFSYEEASPVFHITRIPWLRFSAQLVKSMREKTARRLTVLSYAIPCRLFSARAGRASQRGAELLPHHRGFRCAIRDGRRASALDASRWTLSRNRLSDGLRSQPHAISRYIELVHVPAES